MFDEHGVSAEEVLAALDRTLRADATYRSGHPTASMSTIPHALGAEVFVRTLEKNAGRLHTFQGSAKIEQELLEMIGDLLGLRRPHGTTTSGGTESNILAMLAARELAKKRTDRPEVIAPRTAHSSVKKAAWLLGVRLVATRVDRSYRAVPRAIERAITPDTVGIFVTAGTTYLGQVDPIEQIGEIASEYGLPLHVDAAFGGFVIPFLRDLGLGDYPFDFSVKGVTSVSTDPHKMGLAPIPSGCILFRSSKYLKAITTRVPYLPGASSRQASMLGTRPAASIIAAWAIMRHLGREGYRKVVAQCMETTQHAVERVHLNPMLEAVIPPVMNIVAITSREVPVDRIVEAMEGRGWRMATSPLPSSIRLVIMPHVTRGTLNALFNDLDVVSTTIPAD